MNVGEYVRTKRGEIHKITDLKPHYENGELILEKQLVYIDNKCSGWNYEQFNEIIIKSSPQIINLIEVGDYVNGIKVDDIKNRQLKTASYYDGYICHFCNEDDIKTIITHEQMEAMQYRVEE